MSGKRGLNRDGFPSAVRAKQHTEIFTAETARHVRSLLAVPDGEQAPQPVAAADREKTVPQAGSGRRNQPEAEHDLGRAAPPQASAAENEPVVVRSRHERIVWQAEAGGLVGCLLTSDSEGGRLFELRSGRLFVTHSSACVPECSSTLLLNDPTVSPMHAILRISATAIQILDQLSDYGTEIQRSGRETMELSGEKGVARHGDTIRFGRRELRVCLAELDEEAKFG